MGQLIQRWTRNSNAKFKNWVKDKTTGLANKVASKAGGLYKTAVLDPQMSMNKELAQYNFDKNKEMWDLQNQYNDPKAQRERMEAAGFNPNYLAGGGATGSGNASPASMPQYNAQAPTVDPMGFYARIVQAAQGLIGIRKNMAEVANLKTKTHLGESSLAFQNETFEPRKMTAWSKAHHAEANQALAHQLLGHRSIKNPLERNALEASFDNIQAKTVYQKWQNELAKNYGITSSDNPWFRMGIKALTEANINPMGWIKPASQGLSEYYGKGR